MKTPAPSNPPRSEPAATSPPHAGSAAAIGAPASEPALAAPLHSQHKPLSTQPLSVPSAASCSKSSSPPVPLTAYQERIFQIRRAKYDRAAALIDDGYSKAAAAAEVRWGTTTLWKIEKRLREQGLAGLVPTIGKGSPPLIDPALYTPAVISELQRLAVKLGGSRAAARKFAGSPLCPRPLARYILARGSLPTRLRQMIGFRRTSRTVRVAGKFTYIEGAGIDQEAA